MAKAPLMWRFLQAGYRYSVARDSRRDGQARAVPLGTRYFAAAFFKYLRNCSTSGCPAVGSYGMICTP